MPGEDGFRRYDGRDLRECPVSEALSNLCEGLALAVLQSQPSADLTTQDSVLGDEVLVVEQELLIDSAGDVGKEAFPGHGGDESPHPWTVARRLTGSTWQSVEARFQPKNPHLAQGTVE